MPAQLASPVPREGGWNLRGCSAAYVRWEVIQPRVPERLRKEHSYGVWSPPTGGMIGRMTFRPRSALLVVLLSLALVAGCGSTGPTPSPAAGSPSASPLTSSATTAAPSTPTSASPTPGPTPATSCSAAGASASFSPAPVGPDDPTAAVLTGIEGAVQRIRGITAASSVPRYMLDRVGLCAFLQQSMARDNPPAEVAATEALDKQLGLMPADASLEALYLDLLTSQVVGFYDQHSKAMYVVSSSGSIGPIEQITYAHEFDHALQDQRFDLASIVGTAHDQGDRTLARTALVEGDATLLMSLWAQQNLTPAELLGVAGSTDPASQAALDAAPPILRETLLWPYTQGLSLVLGAYQTSASFAGVDALWKNPPDTTEQLLHPDKLASREAAVAVAFPANFAKALGSGWSIATQDTLGEMQLNIVMRTGSPGAGTDPAAGWGGDRAAMLRGPSGRMAAVLDTSWDTAAAASNAAAKLGQLATTLTTQGKHAAVLQPSPERVVLISADSDATLSLVAGVLGLAG